MIINYPTHYLVQVLPVMSLDEDEPIYNIDDCESFKTYRNMNKDIFYDVDEEYVNKTITKDI
ncbi:MAG TPA: hypothetical protein VIM70_10190 [Clostridium sp.]|uniref:hypothetical protein n=1 Tax=Clostridium sp. TaxID=1506 RepID=UPI002F92BFC0